MDCVSHQRWAAAAQTAASLTALALRGCRWSAASAIPRGSCCSDAARVRRTVPQSERQLLALEKSRRLADARDPCRVDGRRAALAGVLAGEQHAAVRRGERGQVGGMAAGIGARRDVGVATRAGTGRSPSSSWRTRPDQGSRARRARRSCRAVRRRDRPRASPRACGRVRRWPSRRRPARRTRWRGRGSRATAVAASRRS